MANYNTASDCGCRQDMTPNYPMPQRPCPANTPKRQMMPRPCPANMPNRPMPQRPCPANMSQRPCPTDMPKKPCPADMPKKPCSSDMSKRPCPADIPECPPVMPDRPMLDSLAGMPIAMAYVPWQFFNTTFELDKALECGTIFPELSKPFYGKGGCPR